MSALSKALAATACIATALVAAAPVRAAGPALVGDWRFDDGAGVVVHDSSPSGIDGRFGIEEPSWIGGVDGGALRFEGDDAVTVPDSPALAPARITVAAWVRNTGSPGRYAYVFVKNVSSCVRGSYGLYTGSTGGAAFYIAGDGAFTVSPQAAPAVIWDGRWHRLAGTYDGTTVRLYIDGVEVRSGTPGPTHIDYDLPGRLGYIGTYRGGCSLPFAGDVDLLRIWNGALSPAAIVADAHPPTPSDPGSPPQTPPDTPPQTPPGGGGGTPTPDPAPPVGPAKGAPPVSTGSVPGHTASVPGCVSVRVSRRTVKVARRARIGVTVARSGRRLRHAHVVLTSRRLHKALRTNRRGRGRFVVRATRRQHRLTVSVRGSRAAHCSAPKAFIRVKR